MLIKAFANCFLLLVTNLLIKGVKTIKLKLDKYRILRFKILKKPNDEINSFHSKNFEIEICFP